MDVDVLTKMTQLTATLKCLAAVEDDSTTTTDLIFAISSAAEQAETILTTIQELPTTSAA